MAIVRRRYRKLTVNDAILQEMVSPSASVIADYGNVIDIEVDDVAGELDTLDEYMASIGSEAGGTAKPTFAYMTDVDIYVNASTGSDSNPGTASEPLQTLDRALQMVPSEWTGHCRIWLAAGDYSVAGQIGSSGERVDYIGTPIGVNARPMAWMGEFADVSGTLTAVAGSSGTQAVVAGPLTTDDYLGATLLVLTGAAAGSRVQIRGNTTTDILLMNAASNPIGIGDTFRVERPAANIKLDADVTFWQIFGPMSDTAGLNCKGIKFVLGGNFLQFSGVALGCVGVEFDHGGGIVYLEGATVFTQPVWVDPEFQSFDEYHAGIYFNGGGPGYYNVGLFEGSRLYDTFVFNQCSVFAGGIGSEVQCVSVEAVGSYFFMDGPGNFRFVDEAVRGRIRDCTPGSGMSAAITVVQGNGQLIAGLDFGNVTGNAIDIRDCGQAILQDLGNLPATTVTGFGINCDRMSRARRNGGGVAVTGTLGDTSVGGTVTAYGGLPFYNANLSAIE